jgi:hypothetical protein
LVPKEAELFHNDDDARHHALGHVA